MLRHNSPLPGLPDHAFPVSNHDRSDHNTNPMEYMCMATERDSVTTVLRNHFGAELLDWPFTRRLLESSYIKQAITC